MTSFNSNSCYSQLRPTFLTTTWKPYRSSQRMPFNADRFCGSWNWRWPTSELRRQPSVKLLPVSSPLTPRLLCLRASYQGVSGTPVLTARVMTHRPRSEGRRCSHRTDGGNDFSQSRYTFIFLIFCFVWYMIVVSSQVYVLTLLIKYLINLISVTCRTST